MMFGLDDILGAIAQKPLRFAKIAGAFSWLPTVYSFGEALIDGELDATEAKSLAAEISAVDDRDLNRLQHVFKTALVAALEEYAIRFGEVAQG